MADNFHAMNEPNWPFKLADGRIPNLDSVFKFGKNEAVTSTEVDVANLGADEVLLSTPVTLYASNTDNTNGIGQVYIVEGLGPGWLLQSGLVTLNGNAQVPITDMEGGAATWLRVNRSYQVSADPDAVGDTYIAESDTETGGVPDTQAKIHGVVDNTDAAQITEKALYTVPSGKVAFVLSINTFMSQPVTGERSAEVGLEVAELARGASVGNPSWAPRRRIDSMIVTTESPLFVNTYLIPIRFGELTNMSMRAKATVVSTTILGGFTFLLVDE